MPSSDLNGVLMPAYELSPLLYEVCTYITQTPIRCFVRSFTNYDRAVEPNAAFKILCSILAAGVLEYDKLGQFTAKPMRLVWQLGLGGSAVCRFWSFRFRAAGVICNEHEYDMIMPSVDSTLRGIRAPEKSKAENDSRRSWLSNSGYRDAMRNGDVITEPCTL